MLTLSEDELLTLYDALENPPEHVRTQRGLSSEDAFVTAVRFAAAMGCRRSEVLGLRWSDVDLRRGMASIRRTVQEAKSGIYFKEPKNGKEHCASLSDELCAELRSYKARQARVQLAANDYSDLGFVFARLDGSVIRPQTFSQAVKALINRAGFPQVRLHDLRHTHATLLLKEGVHPKIVSSRLDHSSTAITMDLYSHVIPGLDKEAANKFEALVLREISERLAC